MFVLPVSDHVGLVLGLEQAPGFRTHDYVIGTFSVHVEVKHLLGLLSVGDLDFPLPRLRACCSRSRICWTHFFFTVTVAAEVMHLVKDFQKKSVEPSGVPPSLHKSGEVAWGKEGTAGHLALELDFRHPGALQLV